MNDYLFDFQVDQGTLEKSIIQNGNPVKIIFQVTGSSSVAETKSLFPQPTITLNFKERIVLHASDLRSTYLICILSQRDSEELFTDTPIYHKVAISKCSLGSFPFGKPKTFKIPLNNISNFKETLCRITIHATISSINLSHPVTLQQPGFYVQPSSQPLLPVFNNFIPNSQLYPQINPSMPTNILPVSCPQYSPPMSDNSISAYPVPPNVYIQAPFIPQPNNSGYFFNQPNNITYSNFK